MALTAYKVVKANDARGLDGLATSVLAAAVDGWLPLGGIVPDGSGGFYQTLIKGDIAGVAGTGDVYILPAAGAAIGGVKKAAAVADSVVDDAADIADLVASFNDLLAKLRTAGTLTP